MSIETAANAHGKTELSDPQKIENLEKMVRTSNANHDTAAARQALSKLQDLCTEIWTGRTGDYVRKVFDQVKADDRKIHLDPIVGFLIKESSAMQLDPPQQLTVDPFEAKRQQLTKDGHAIDGDKSGGIDYYPDTKGVSKRRVWTDRDDVLGKRDDGTKSLDYKNYIETDYANGMLQFDETDHTGKPTGRGYKTENPNWSSHREWAWGPDADDNYTLTWSNGNNYEFDFKDGRKRACSYDPRTDKTSCQDRK